MHILHNRKMFVLCVTLRTYIIIFRISTEFPEVVIKLLNEHCRFHQTNFRTVPWYIWSNLLLTSGRDASLFHIIRRSQFLKGTSSAVERLHLDSLLKNKRPTWCHLLFYFPSYVLNMFRTLIYLSSGPCDYSVELPHWAYCSWFHVCWSFGVVGLEWYPCCKLKRATRIPLQTNHTETPTHIEPRKYDQCGNSTE